MANEIANRSQAGIVAQFFEDPDVPIILASWGVDVAAGFTREAATADGLYSIPLTDPGSGIPNAALDGFTSLDFLILQSGAKLAESTDFVSATLGPAAGAVPVAGEPTQLPLLLVQFLDAAGAPIDQDGVINVEVRRVPQQD